MGLLHGPLNLSATGLCAVSLALRLRGVRTPGRTIGGLGFTVALGAAYLGGHLVTASGSASTTRRVRTGTIS